MILLKEIVRVELKEPEELTNCPSIKSIDYLGQGVETGYLWWKKKFSGDAWKITYYLRSSRYCIIGRKDFDKLKITEINMLLYTRPKVVVYDSLRNKETKTFLSLEEAKEYCKFLMNNFGLKDIEP